MDVVMGVDPSFKKTGICIVTNGDIKSVRFKRIETRPNGMHPSFDEVFSACREHSVSVRRLCDL